MKLVIATPLYPPESGGPATYAKLLFEGLPKKGIEVELVKFSDVRYLPKLFRHYVYYRRILKAARNADVILALDPVSVGLPAMLAANRARKPFVVKIVGDYAWEQGQQRFGVTQNLDDFVRTEQKNFFVRKLQGIQKRVAQNATKIIVPSEYLKGIVMAWGIPNEKIEVIYNAVSVEERGMVPEEVMKLPRPLIVTVGRLVPWKNIDGVIDAVAAIPGASLAVVDDGPLRSALERHANETLPRRVVFTGRLSREDTLAVIKSADAFVLNSSYEGLSHLLIEAVLLGVPVIATDAGGNKEVVNNANGTLVPVGDTGALVRALTERKLPKQTAELRFAIVEMLSRTSDVLRGLGHPMSTHMNVLMISGDKNILKEGGEVRARFELQKSQVDQLDVFVWPQIHSAREKYKAAQATSYDVITAQDPFWRGLLAWRIARRTGAKLNIQVHTDLSAHSFWRRRLASFILRRADSVRAVSEKIKRQVQGLRCKVQVYVLPIFVDISRFQNLVPIPHVQKTILWIGRFEPEKDPLYAVRILIAVRAKDIDAKLIMLGSGSLEPALQQLARVLPVELPGWQDPIPYLQTADVVLCTSKHESWGASIVEALASGVPVVAPDVGIAREAGATVVPRSDLGNAIISILNSGERGELKISLPGADEWAKRWRETLI